MNVAMNQKNIILETERMLLRVITPDDLNELYSLHCDEDVMRFLVKGKRSSLDEVKADLKAYMRHYEEHGFGKFATICRSTGEFMGRAGFVVVPETGEIEMGYTFHKKYWGQGLATELANAMFAFGETQWPRSKIISTVMPGNRASVRVLEKIGFRYIGNESLFGTILEVYRPS